MKSRVFTPRPVSFAIDDTEDVTTLRHLRRQAGYFILSRYHFGLQHKAPKVKRERPAEFELCITSMLFCEFAYNQRLVCNIFGVMDITDDEFVGTDKSYITVVVM